MTEMDSERNRFQSLMRVVEFQYINTVPGWYGSPLHTCKGFPYILLLNLLIGVRTHPGMWNFYLQK